MLILLKINSIKSIARTRIMGIHKQAEVSDVSDKGGRLWRFRRSWGNLFYISTQYHYVEFIHLF